MESDGKELGQAGEPNEGEATQRGWDGGAPGAAAGGYAAGSAKHQATLSRARQLENLPDSGSDQEHEDVGGLGAPGVAESAFAALADNVRDYAIFLLNPDGVITYWGEGARLLKWWTKREAEGSHLRLLYPDGGSEDGTAEQHLRQAAEAGEYTGEGHRVRSDGSLFWAGVTLTALRDQSGNLVGFAKVTRDLTADRAAEAARQAALEAAEEANRLKSLFLATMSHEIRTPLNAIMAYTDLLGMETAGSLTEAQHQQLGKVRSSSQHLLGLVEDVLDLGRIESGRMVVGSSGFRIGTAISEAIMLVEQQARAREVELVDAVSGLAADHHTVGDEERVRQILVNLLSNAVKFTSPAGRVTVSAGTTSRPPRGVQLEGRGPWLYVRVEDTGQGIPADRIDPIFEPFIQADMSLTRQHGGTGLGLSISRSLARLMGGELSVRSEEGVGSAFFLWLPSVPDPAARPTESKVSAPLGAGPLDQSGDALLDQLDRIIQGYVSRLRSDPQTPAARSLPPAELEYHLVSLLTDVGQTLRSLDVAAGSDSGSLRDGTAIQRTISARHGQQRARLGWSEQEVRREFSILREEVADAIRRELGDQREMRVEASVKLVDRFIEMSEHVSIEAHRRERGTAA